RSTPSSPSGRSTPPTASTPTRRMARMAMRPASTQPQADGRGGPGAEARVRARERLDRLWRRGREFLGTELAIMGGAMTWVSERNLVAAISNAGGFGVIASGSMPPELLDAEIAATAALT